MINLVKVLRYSLLTIMLAFAGSLHAQLSDPIIPNVFTPNGDKINDTFTASGLSGSWTMLIYDRWGNLIFSTEQVIDDGWDGHNFLGLEVVEGVYYYILKQKNTDNSYNGAIQLLR